MQQVNGFCVCQVSSWPFGVSAGEKGRNLGPGRGLRVLGFRAAPGQGSPGELAPAGGGKGTLWVPKGEKGVML